MHGDECVLAALLIERVNGAREDLLARSGLTLQKYGRATDLSGLVRALQDRVHAQRGCHESKSWKHLAECFGFGRRLNHGYTLRSA